MWYGTRMLEGLIWLGPFDPKSLCPQTRLPDLAPVDTRAPGCFRYPPRRRCRWHPLSHRPAMIGNWRRPGVRSQCSPWWWSGPTARSHSWRRLPELCPSKTPERDSRLVRLHRGCRWHRSRARPAPKLSNWWPAAGCCARRSCFGPILRLPPGSGWTVPGAPKTSARVRFWRRTHTDCPANRRPVLKAYRDPMRKPGRLRRRCYRKNPSAR